MSWLKSPESKGCLSKDRSWSFSNWMCPHSIYFRRSPSGYFANWADWLSAIQPGQLRIEFRHSVSARRLWILTVECRQIVNRPHPSELDPSKVRCLRSAKFRSGSRAVTSKWPNWASQDRPHFSRNRPTSCQCWKWSLPWSADSPECWIARWTSFPWKCLIWFLPCRTSRQGNFREWTHPAGSKRLAERASGNWRWALCWWNLAKLAVHSNPDVGSWPPWHFDCGTRSCAEWEPWHREWPNCKIASPF